MHPADQDLPDEIIQNGVNLRVIKQAYDWLLDDDGSIHGLTAGDHGFEPTGIKLSMADLVALAQPSPSSDATITRTPLSSEFRETVARNIDIGKQAGKPAAEPQP